MTESSAGPLLLGFDVGTSAVKAGAFDLAGRRIAQASRPVPLQTPFDGACEVDPRDYWEALRGACADLWGAGVDPERVRALAVAAHAETLLPLDADLEPVRPGIVWVDTRSVREAEELGARFGVAELVRRSGQPEMIPMWPATKLLWLRRHEPERAARVRWWLQPLDYLTARLTGRVSSDASEYSSSLMLDIATRGWWQPMLDALGVSTGSLPELVPAGTPLGTATASARRELGLAPGTTVVMGGFDQACTALGAGNLRPGVVSESTGTSLAVVATVDRPPAGAGAGGVPCHVHVAPGKYFLCAHNPAAGSIVRWFQSALAPELSFAEIDAEAATAPPGCEGLVVLPAFSGTATPTFDAGARGVLYGLTLRHDRSFVARAILEGVAFSLAELIDAERALGVEPGELRSVGGGARSALWSQIKADVTGLPVRTTASPNLEGAVGAAIIAGVGEGLFAGLAEGADALVRFGGSFEPDPSRAEAYAEARQVHGELYPAVAGIFARHGARG